MFATNSMQTDFHSHYAATLAISLEKNITIETDLGKEEYRVALVGPNTYHRTISPGVEMVALLIDPETYEFGSISESISSGEVKKLEIQKFLPLIDSLWSLYYGDLSDDEATQLQFNLLRTVYPFDALKTTVDPRIQKIAKRIRMEIPSSIRMKEIGKDFSISEDRLIRLFKENLGIPLRRYLLWVRILRAVKELKAGNNLTDAAHAAGFSDSAHFSRTFKENFGFIPSLFFGHLKTAEVRFCEPDEKLR
ncbi:helix-turn-helix transcriptional regulator [Leptospira vanthielii]|uniref:DNA-binding helix-turn-helix protein n=1 Tax=Leptospira vanthielii serovar Holland str. Waz Holland = ATCC 700522 TaxID=1218591 RepID=N1WEV9_9LEPT|nr:AraC family transcriptional regulator [Leptospira vanthielii]EMY71762.1 DNA-binding helix-turn-helix protein [Leptospira vanthielii serovar Holland str. Waz Holland = ATCC 700522]